MYSSLWYFCETKPKICLWVSNLLKEFLEENTKNQHKNLFYSSGNHQAAMFCFHYSSSSILTSILALNGSSRGRISSDKNLVTCRRRRAFRGFMKVGNCRQTSTSPPSPAEERAQWRSWDPAGRPAARGWGRSTGLAGLWPAGRCLHLPVWPPPPPLGKERGSSRGSPEEVRGEGWAAALAGSMTVKVEAYLSVSSSLNHGHDDVLCGHEGQLVADVPLDDLWIDHKTLCDVLQGAEDDVCRQERLGQRNPPER